MNKYCNYCMSPLEAAEETCPVCGRSDAGTVPAHHLLPGTVLNGKFYVGRALGEGGFGITYIGRDIKLDMKVAIKEFYPNGYVNRSNTISAHVNDSVTEGRRDFFEKGRERFLKEAQILAKFSGEPGVVDVRDFFEENNTAYIIMEFLDGMDLKTYLKKYGTLTAEQTVQLLMPVMNSLKKVHSQGLIHRDISPDNIMIVGSRVKLLDFGAARTVSAAANKSLSVMLKPGYAPEEQYRSKGNQGPWTDIYALCATMYKCITGITPDDATQRVFSDEVKTPSALNISIKPEIEKAIMRGMSVHQNDRYQSIDDLIRGLQGIEVSFDGSGQTVAFGKPVSQDSQETLFIPNGADDRTMLGDDAATVMPADDQTEYRAPTQYGAPAAAAPVSAPQPAPVSAPQPVKAAEKPAKGKSKGGMIAVAAIAAVAILAVVLVFVLKGGDGEKPGGTEPADPGTQSTENPENTQSTQNSEPSTDSTQSTQGEVTQPPTQPVEEIKLSDNLFDFTFELEGVVYQLPCKLDAFTKNGWAISSSGYSGDTKIPGNSYESFTMARDGKEITVYSYNPSGNMKAIKDCKVGGIASEVYTKTNLVLSKGIALGANEDAVRAAYGAPGQLNTGTSSKALLYLAGKDTTYNCVKFYFYDDHQYSSVEIKNFVETEEDKTVTNPERPAFLDSYKAPAAFGSGLTSGVVKIEGAFYQLPAPVSAFLNNGWQIIQQSGDLVAGDSDYITVQKDGKNLILYIVNMAEYQTVAENCVVYKLSVDSDDSAPIYVGNDQKQITLGSAKADVEALITDEFDYYDGINDTYSYSEYKQRDFNMSVSVDKTTGAVMNIYISCETWGY